MRKFVDPQVDLYTPEGVYLVSVVRSADGKYRYVQMYIDPLGRIQPGTISMLTPDYHNNNHMNLKVCPHCKGRSSTCEDCCGCGWGPNRGVGGGNERASS